MIQTEEERSELAEYASSCKANAKIFREQAELVGNRHIKRSLESIAATFSVNAKILEAYSKSSDPEKDKYHKLFPNGQED